MVFVVITWWSSQILNTHHSTFTGVAMFVPFEDIVTEMEKTISMLLEEVSQKVWQDMASLLDLGHRTTSCNYRMLCVAGQHPLYWSCNGQGQCYNGQHQWLERKGHSDWGSSTPDIGHRPIAIKSLHKEFFFPASCCLSTAVATWLGAI